MSSRTCQRTGAGLKPPVTRAWRPAGESAVPGARRLPASYGARVRLVLVSLLSFAAVVGCADDAPSTSPPVSPATVTATITETVTETATAVVTVAPGPTSGPSTGGLAGRPTAEPSPRPLPKLQLEVFTDGCAVIRSDDPPASTYQNLTWVFRDQDGFQVLGRVAEGETHYRYFAPGTYDVVLEAFGDGHYVPVSNEVTVRC